MRYLKMWILWVSSSSSYEWLKQPELNQPLTSLFSVSKDNVNSFGNIELYNIDNITVV